jgi:hypothetical protein
VSIQFIPPLDSQKQVLDELEKLTALLSKPQSPGTKQRKLFLNSFTRSLFLAGKKQTKSIRKPEEFIQPREQIKPQINPISRPFEPEIPLVRSSFLQQPKLPPMPPPPSPQKPAVFQQQKEVLSSLKEEDGKLVFDVTEPLMEAKDLQIYDITKEKLYQNALKNPSLLEDSNYLSSLIQQSCKELKIKFSEDYIRKIKYYLVKNIRGYGKIDPLMRDSRVSSIICNSYNDIKVIFQDKQLPTTIIFDSNQELNNFILTLGDRFNVKVSELAPSLDIKDSNLEIHALYNPITTSRFIIKKLV